MKPRLKILAAALFFWMVCIALRLAALQVFQYHDWMVRAQRQQQRVIELSPARGVIYDRNGLALAMSVQVDSVFAVPADVPDHATAAGLLGGVLNLPARELQEKLDSGKTFVWIARKVDPAISARLRELNLKGIYFQSEPKRFYPKQDLAAQVLGYVGLDDAGLGGIELNYDDTLRGITGSMHVSVDARRKRLNGVEQDPEPGENIVLTIDQTIQHIAEVELQKAMEDTHAVAATIVVENPHTGEILALANRPTFNPNTFDRVPQEQLKNRAISDVYEPGSVFKVVTLSSALEEKITRPDEVIDCQMGAIVVAGHTIHDHQRLGLLTVAEVLSKSSDVGAIKIGLRLGKQRFDHYIRGYGFGATTGIELPGETRGLLKPVARWSEVSNASMSMGQEIGVTPIQTTAMVSTIANDGVWNAPRIVAGITPPNSGPQLIAFHPAAPRRVISALTAAEMKKMMEGVVLFGTGRKAILDGYTSAGKTGTAQKVDPKTHRYSTTRYVGSFIGFAPVNQPAITIGVIIDSAVGLHQGGQVAAPVFKRVAQQVLEYLHVPNDVELKHPPVAVARAAAPSETLPGTDDRDLEEGSPDHPGDTLSLDEPAPGTPKDEEPGIRSQEPGTHTAAAARPAAQPILAAASASESVNAAEGGPLPPPIQPGPLPSSGTVIDVDTAEVPSFAGHSLRGAVELAQDAGIVLDAHGWGIACEQSPPAGARIPRGGRVSVRFAR